MEELTEKKIIQIHDFLIEETGGNPGIRDSATSEIMRVMVRIAQYTCPEGEEIDTIAKWLKKTVVRLE